ncbi:uncharacterized protein N7459_009852 [Penicillium hispanicum]|uniref:uncharacterized protein n=1 Tax=Penicillium hispanicum TaxID=1080232 RepID=UPI00253FF83C|nr:uncharacterized protein N7459_009852 [Penicillium hispanicum]KAJ5570422.1 hypothetical protein N7459_009852 [Penicillium hispanicum]
MGKPKNEKSLTHEEIWDDSALVRSWDEAVEEYQLYHSIYAKGESVEDALKEAEVDGLAEESYEPPEAESLDTDVPMEGETEEETASSSNPQIPPTRTLDPQVSTSQESVPADAPGPKFPTGAMPMPEPILSNMQDEGLKRLMMAWYFAGYYTGLYEGQQQATSQEKQ